MGGRAFATMVPVPDSRLSRVLCVCVCVVLYYRGSQEQPELVLRVRGGEGLGAVRVLRSSVRQPRVRLASAHYVRHPTDVV
jgi:hypothetical protein